VDLPEASAGGAAGEGPPLRLWAPDGQSRPLPAGVRRAAVGPLDQCGVWRIAADAEGPAFLEIACNLADRRESDLRAPDGWRAAADPSAGGPGGRPLWFYLLAAAGLLLALEWGLYQRRWIT
jgi:hypothetical protein